MPGTRFLVKTSVAAGFLPRLPNAPLILVAPTVSEKTFRSDEAATLHPAGGWPDFASAMRTSAERKSETDRSLSKILTVLDSTPAKRQAAKRAQTAIASVFSEVWARIVEKSPSRCLPRHFRLSGQSYLLSAYEIACPMLVNGCNCPRLRPTLRI